jgi:hypothetical protein
VNFFKKTTSREQDEYQVTVIKNGGPDHVRTVMARTMNTTPSPPIAIMREGAETLLA